MKKLLLSTFILALTIMSAPTAIATTNFDINEDGRINTLDLEYVKYMASLSETDANYDLWEPHFHKGDFNGDARVDESDIEMLLNQLESTNANQTLDRSQILDINTDGFIDEIDLKYFDFMASLNENSPEYNLWKDFLTKADVNKDNKIDSKDRDLINNSIGTKVKYAEELKVKTELEEVSKIEDIAPVKATEIVVSDSGIKATETIVTSASIDSIPVIKEPQADTLEMKIYKALDNVESTLVLYANEISDKDLYQKINEIAKDDKFFYYQGFKFVTYGDKTTVTFIYPKNQNTLAKKTALENAVRKIIAENINNSMTEYEKVKAIHDYIVSNTAYDYDNFIKNTLSADAFNAYGVLVNRVAVCQGYAEAMNILLKECGVNSQLVVGVMNEGGGHAWNIVQVDGEYYQIDATHDDPVPNVEGKILYNYFLTTDENMRKTRTWDASQYPVCNATKHNYYVYNNLLVDSKTEFFERVKEAIDNKKDSVIVATKNFEFNEDVLREALVYSKYYSRLMYTIDKENGAIRIYELKY